MVVVDRMRGISGDPSTFPIFVRSLAVCSY